MFAGVAISGKMRTGKDTTAHALLSHGAYHRFGFADTLKQMATDSTGVDLFNEENKKKHRPFLIALGQAYRTFDKDFWVSKTLGRIDGVLRNPDNEGMVPVITDLRFTNEADKLRKAGFLLVRLECPADEIERRGGQILADPSETDLDDYPKFDLIFRSDLMTPDEIAAAIHALVSEKTKQAREQVV